MTLNEITQRIGDTQRLAEHDPASALEQNLGLFIDIARQDSIYIVPSAAIPADTLASKTFSPYAAPAQEDDPRLFLRIFSHDDPAYVFSERSLGSPQAVELDGVEMMQLARFYFLRGLYGFLLNDGLAWAAISFPDFLKGCFSEKILGDEKLARPEFIALVQVINMVRQGDHYKMVLARQMLKDAQKAETLFFLDQAAKSRFNGPEYVFEELNMAKLLQQATAPEDARINIWTGRTRCQVSAGMLRAAFCAAGITEQERDPSLDFHTDSIALEFGFRDLEGNPAAQDLKLASLPGPNETAARPKGKSSKACAARVAAFWAGLKKGIRTKAARLTPDTDLSPKEERPRKRPKLSSALMVKGFFLAAFLMVVVFFLTSLAKPTPIKEATSSIEAGNYAGIAALYESCVKVDSSNRDILIPLMSQDLSDKLAAYAADECTATELAEAIDAYRSIPAMEQACSSAYNQAAALETSKLAYQQGLSEFTILARLECWRGVIEADTGSMAAMRDALAKNAEQYKASAFIEAEEMQPKAALSKMYMLQTFYPDDQDVLSEITMLQANAFHQQGSAMEATVPDNEPVSAGDSLIQVSGISTSPAGIYGNVNLYIKWMNTSGKDIEQIYFTLVPLDYRGSELATTVDNGDGLYSKFIAAMDAGMGPYADGYVAPDDFYWKDAWSNHSIVSAKLVEVSIFFVGENAPVTISDPDRIAAMLQTAESPE